MTPAEQKNYFAIIQEQIDSKNLVTFKWLSRKCRIHCIIAKQLLSEFIDKSAGSKYSVTYVVFRRGPNGELVISLSDERDLSDSIEDTTVVDKHIYSIECSPSDISTDELYNDDKLSFQLELMNLSSINYPGKICKKPNARRISVSTSDSKKNINDEKSEDKLGTSALKIEPKREKTNKLNFTSLPKSKNEVKPASKTEDNSPKKVLSIKSEAESKTHNVKAPSTGKGSLSALFQNHRVKHTTTSSLAGSKNEKSDEAKTENSIVKEKQYSPEISQEKYSAKIESTKLDGPAKTNKTRKTSKKNSSKSKKKPEKKNRKRISRAFDSSSDESGSDGESSEKESPFDQIEDEPEPDHDKHVEPEPEPASFIPGKKRKRKIMEKSGLGEDGFFYTTKEVVYESCDSDDNDENDPNVNQDSNKRLKTSEVENSTNSVSKAKAASPTVEKSNVKNQKKAKTKQASIMNFFKKS